MEGIGRRIVTASPDVSVSTNLGGWINRVGVFSADRGAPSTTTRRGSCAGSRDRRGQHIELGISEMDLFMWLSQFGLTAELFDEPLVPLGTVYDPFIARGLDALIHALYIGSRFILVATPSGVTLAPEGGAHQSSVTPSLGIELPGLHSLGAGVRPGGGVVPAGGDPGCPRPRAGGLLLVPAADDARRGPVARGARPGAPGRGGVAAAGARGWLSAAGGRRGRGASVGVALPADAPGVTVVAVGAVVPEAVEAVRQLVREEVAASLVVVTSADRLSAELAGRRLRSIRRRLGRVAAPPGHAVPGRRPGAGRW